METKDWLLLTVAEGAAEGLSPVQLQKGVFLVCEMVKQTKKDECYVFEPHNYGPFSANVYAEAEALEQEGLVDIHAAAPRRYARYTATSEGEQRASALRDSLDEPTRDYLRQVVQWVKQKTFPELIRAIYHFFPDYNVNSVFRG